MPQRPPTVAQRLRSAWRRTSDSVLTSAGVSPDQRASYKGSDFADRLRAAVATRH